MGDLKQLGERIREAMQIYGARTNSNRATNPDEYAAALAQSMFRQDPIPRQNVLNWMAGTEAPNFDTLMAMARLAGWEKEAQFRRFAYGADMQVYSMSSEDYNAYYPGPKLDIKPNHPYRIEWDR